jgi:hypothetical protein
MRLVQGRSPRPGSQLVRGHVELDRLAGTPPEADQVDGKHAVALGEDGDRRRPPAIGRAQAVHEHDRRRVTTRGRGRFEPRDAPLADARHVALLPGHGASVAGRAAGRARQILSECC